MKKILMPVIGMMLMTGCATQTYLVGQTSQLNPTEDKMQPFFVAGIGQEQETNAATVCGGVDKIGKIQTEQTFLNGLLGGLTNGLFTPRQIRVYCK